MDAVGETIRQDFWSLKSPEEAREPCPWRIRKLRRDRHLEQTAAMVPPSVVVKDGMGGRRFSGSFSWSAATERLVNAIPL